MIDRLFIVFFILCFFAGCGDDKDDPSADRTYYYSVNGSEKQSFHIGDTLSTTLGDDLTLYIDHTETPAIYIDDPSELVAGENGAYHYTSAESFVSTVAIKFGQDGADPIWFYCYVDTQPLVVAYTLLSTDYEIDLENLSLRNEIEAELKQHYSPLELSTYKLSYTRYDASLQTGGGTMDYVSVGMENQSYTGTFDKKQDKLTMQYNDKSFAYILYKEEAVYYFKQDLTDVFKLKYPSEIINSVTVTSRLLTQNSRI